ncbi:MAG: PAS domain S-box protein [Bacteroidales bacterium]|nr:PAS domain S-box protein [Bacteroidales bacterium]
MIYNKKIFIFSIILIILLSLNYSFSQSEYQVGLPFIKNYKTDELNVNQQNWSIIQDNQGIMYFANSEGVLQFDGVQWRIIDVMNKKGIRCINIDTNGVIYVCVPNNFGYLINNNKGKLLYKSLSEQLDEKNIGTVWKVIITKESVYFIAGRNKIYKYHKNKLTKIYIDTSFTRFRCFLIDDAIYAADISHTMGKIINDSLTKINFKENNLEDIVYTMLPLEKDKILIGTRSHGLYIWKKNDKNLMIKFNIKTDNFFENNQIYSGIKLKNKNIILASLQKGIIILNPKGEIINKINKNDGLLTNTIYDLFEDKNNNIWLACEKGISRIELNSPITCFNEINGLEGSLLSSIYYNNNLFIGTSSGIYYLSKYQSDDYPVGMTLKAISDKYMYNLDFHQINDNQNNSILLSSTLREVIYIEGTEVKGVVKEIYACNSICPSLKKKGRVFLGSPRGIDIISIKFPDNSSENIEFIDEGILEGYNEDVKKIVCDNNGDLWIGTKYNGIDYIKFNENEKLSDYKIYKYDTLSGLPDITDNLVFNIDGKLIFSTAKGMYKISDTSLISKNPEQITFQPDYSYGLDYSKDFINIYEIKKDKKNNLWLGTNLGIYKIVKEKDKSINIISKPFLRTPKMDIETMLFDDKGIFWYSISSCLYRFDSAFVKNYDNKFNALIRKIILNKDSVIFYGGIAENVINQRYDGTQFLIMKDKIAFKDNSVSFEFAAPFFENETANNYSHILEGYENTWSNWTSENKVGYTNLYEGTYIFKVKAKNIYETESYTATLKFIVLPPWYRTIVAYISYILFFIIAVYISIKIYTYRLKIEKEHLEELVKLRTYELEQQKEEINAQAEKLIETNEELENLSIVARNTINAVVIMDADGNFEWVNEGFTRMYGLSFKEFVTKVSSNIRTASSNPVVIKAIDKCIKEKIPIIYQFKTKDNIGKQLWAQTTLSPILDKKGDIRKIVAIDTDISKMKEAEKEITKQKEEIKQQADILEVANKELEKLSIVASKTDNAVSIMDPVGNYKWINDGFTQIYGYTIEQLIKDKGRIKIGTNANLRINDLVDVLFGNKKSIIYESLNSTLSGEKIWIQTTLTPVLNEQRNIEKLVAIDTDISKLKNAEEQIEAQKDEIQAQRDLAVNQRDELSFQKQEIIDSIIYAKRIQNAILPSKVIIDKMLSEYFILYEPRDIVSGDFYWITNVNGKTIVAATDCTGHGVPGAFMSLIGITFLNEIVNNIKNIKPNVILNKLREYIISSLQQTGREGEARDGMDISLCIIDWEKNILQYSGANNPLFIISNNELTEIKADKMPISIHRRGHESFTNHTIHYNNGDIIYMFTDGYTDQFGGPNGKKFKIQKFKDLLLSIKNIDMIDQNKLLRNTLRNWQGKLEQVDDILVMGIKLIKK